MLAVIGYIVALTSDQTIALRLLESLLILVPIWLAITQYMIGNIVNFSEDLDGQHPREAIAVAFISSSYFILVLSLAGIRAVLSPGIDSTYLLAVIDLIVLFLIIVMGALYFSLLKDKSGGFFDSLEDRFEGRDTWHAISALTVLVFIVYWLLIGSLLLEILAWALERIYIQW